MAATPSTMVPLGFKAPDFSLLDTVSNTYKSLNELKSDAATVIMFICNHCPFVKHVNAQLVKLALDYQPKGISFIAINSNDADNYPEDSPEKMKEYATKLNYPFPYLLIIPRKLLKHMMLPVHQTFTFLTRNWSVFTEANWMTHDQETENP